MRMILALPLIQHRFGIYAQLLLLFRRLSIHSPRMEKVQPIDVRTYITYLILQFHLRIVYLNTISSPR